MPQKSILHSPTLESVLMVERFLRTDKRDLTKYGVWKRLPKKMMYQTFMVIIDYLEESGKIHLDKDGTVVWIWNPEHIEELKAKGLLWNHEERARSHSRTKR